MREKGFSSLSVINFAFKDKLRVARQGYAFIGVVDNEVAAALYKNGELYLSRRYRVHIVDRVGGGDALTAAYLYTESAEIADRLVTETDPAAQIDFACAANAFKHSVEGDVNIASPAEIAAAVRGSVRLTR